MRVTSVSLSRKKRYLPPIIGLFSMALVIIILNFPWLYAQFLYSAHGVSILSNNKVSAVAPHVSQKPEIYIPQINAKAPIIFGVSPYNDEQVQRKLRDGVVHYDTTAEPGQPGNVVVFGHSSGQLWAPGHYKYIFTLLDKLKPGDKIYIDYKDVRYTYQVQGKRTVEPTDLTVLEQPNASILSLITCTPVGVNKYRLVVEAKQISAKNGETQSSNTDTRKFQKKMIEMTYNIDLKQRLIGL